MTKFFSAFLALLAIISGVFSNLNFKVNYYVHENMYYGTEERQCLDVVIPGNYEGDLGLVLYVHGGSWSHGDKNGWLSSLKSITKNKGYAAASLNYRYIDDDTDCFDILDDFDAALAKIKEMCAKKGINIKNVILYGTSAGAHLSLLYAYSRKDTAPITPAAVISNCAPTDLTLDSLYFDTILGRPQSMAALFSDLCGYQFTIDNKDSHNALQALLKASPIYYINENTVPTLISHGVQDRAISFLNATLLDEKLTAYGVEHDFIIHPNSGHSLDKDPIEKAKRISLTFKYFDRYLCKSAFSDTDTTSDYEDITDDIYDAETDPALTMPVDPATTTLPDITDAVEETTSSSEITTIPQTTVPQTTVPQTTVPQTTVPQTTVPQTTVPQAEY